MGTLQSLTFSTFPPKAGRGGWLAAAGLFALTQILYAPTLGAGFVTDFTGLQARLDGAPFRDFLTCFGFPAMHQATNFFLYWLYHFFETQALPWHLVFTSLHAANAFLGFVLAKKNFARAGVSEPHFPALAGSLLFLCSPYAAEAVVWKVGFGFLFCSLMMLASLGSLAAHLETGRRRHLLLSHLFFVVALFSFELAVVTPLLAAVLVLWWKNAPPVPETSKVLKTPMFIALPQALLLAGWFALNKIVLGGWVGHYGEAVHLRFDPAAMSGNLLKYFTKHLFFWRELPHAWREKLVAFCDLPATGWAALAAGLLLLAAGVVFLKKMPPPLCVAALCGLLFFIALLPVSNLYVAWILQGENDRYSYLPSLFFFMGLAALLLFLPKTARLAAFAALLLLSIFLLHRMTVFWKNSNEVCRSLLEDFRWQDAPEVCVLAFPENYRGIPMFKDFSRSDLALRHALKYGAGKEPKGKIFQIAQFNMTSPGDGVTVQLDSARHFTATFNQWGNWWWRNGIGAGDLETDAFKFKVDGNGAKIEVKKPKAGAVFIWSVGGKWHSRGG